MQTFCRKRIGAAFGTVLTTALLLGTVTDTTAASAVGTRASRHVHVVEYNLGATAFTVPGLLSAKHHPGPMELIGRVDYPADISHGNHPLVLMMHGYWPTCSDPRAQAVIDDPNSSDRALDHAYYEIDRWPCAKHTPPLTSYRGYDYLARTLAERGNVVVSISANGANAIDTYHFQGDQARVALISENLQMWENFTNHRRGPLARILPHQLVGHVNMRDVGLLGHSRAGRAVLQYASDRNRRHWPRGVTVAAVLGLAPAQADPGLNYTTTHLPVGLVYGNCDGAVGPDDYYYYAPTAAHSPHDIYEWRISGANHDYWNIHWSPSSGQVGANDDATPDPHKAHYCENTIAAFNHPGTVNYVHQLSENRQRRYGSGYVGAFFTDSLHRSSRYRALLDGSKPLPGVTTQHHAKP